jgi:small subunit ribosomal protein S4
VVNGEVVNVPSFHVKPGFSVGVRERSKSLEVINNTLASRHSLLPWLEWDEEKMTGKVLNYPQRDEIPENINEQIIVELYSK